MSIDVLIKAYKNIGFGDVPVEEVVNDLQELEELYKPIDVPQFVANWYEKNKSDFEYNLWDWLRNKTEVNCADGEVTFFMWINDCTNKPVETLVCMHQFGYKVEKEKLYTVKMRGLGIDEAFLKFQLDDEYWYMGIVGEYKHARGRHTRKELEEAGFGDVFNSQMFEVEEVEE